MTKGQFKIQKLLDVGTSNPIVAGLTIGLHDIVAMAELDKEAKDAIITADLNIAQYNAPGKLDHGIGKMKV